MALVVYNFPKNDNWKIRWKNFTRKYIFVLISSRKWKFEDEFKHRLKIDIKILSNLENLAENWPNLVAIFVSLYTTGIL